MIEGDEKMQEMKAPKGVQNARRQRPGQKRVIRASGLDPYNWLVVKDSGGLLHLVDRGIERREERVIDKETKRILA